MQFPALPAMKKYTATPLSRPREEPPDRKGHQQKWAPQGPIKGDLYTFRGLQAPEQGKHVPEVGLEPHSHPATTGLPRKRNESEPVRHHSDPIRSPKCVLCTHPKLPSSKDCCPTPRAGVQLFCILRQETSGTEFRPAAASGALCRGGQKTR